jgi:hypothetical protein
MSSAIVKNFAQEATEKAIKEASQKAIKEATEKVVKEAAQKAVKEASQKAIKAAAEKAAKEAAQKTVKAAAEKAAKEAAQKLAKETAEKLAKETAEKATKKTLKETAKDVAKKTAKFVANNPKKIAAGLLAVGLATDAGLNSLKKNSAQIVITSIENAGNGNLRIIIDNAERQIEINPTDTIIIKGSNSIPSIDGTYKKSIIVDINAIELPGIQVTTNGTGGVMSFDTNFLSELKDTTTDTAKTAVKTVVSEVLPAIGDVMGDVMEEALKAAGIDPKIIENVKKYISYVPYVILAIICIWLLTYVKGFLKLVGVIKGGHDLSISGGNIIDFDTTYKRNIIKL